MKFNPELIQKARKGEIAILNDGSVEELNLVLKEVWPDDSAYATEELSYSFYHSNKNDPSEWRSRNSPPQTPTASVKDFFMPDTKTVHNPQDLTNEERHKILSHRMTNEQVADRISEPLHQPRTYRVTRQQMGIICSALKGSTEVVYNIMANRFALFDQEAYLHDEDISMLNSICPDPDDLKKYFPEYFFIPEGKTVLYRDYATDLWKISVSAGSGLIYNNPWVDCNTFIKPQQIIPFTKNPPK